MSAAVPPGLTDDTAEAVRLLVAYGASIGIAVAINSGVRSCAYQHALYAQGRTAPGPRVTDADGCLSWHVLGRAVDLTIAAGPKDYAALAAYWRSIGGRWGGDWTGQSASLHDVGHFEYHPGLVRASEVCVNPAACVVDHAKNAPRVYPTDHDGGGAAPSGDGGSSPGLGALLALAALAVGVGLYAGRNHR